MRPLETLAVTLVCALCAGWVAACAGAGSGAEHPTSGTRRAPDDERARTNQQAAQAPALDSRQLVVVPGGTFGPYVGRQGSSNVLVWATRDRQGKERWQSLAVKDAQSVGQPMDIANAPSQLSLVVVRSAGKTPADGFVVVAAEPDAEQATLHALQLGEGGQLAGGPFELAQTPGPVLWLDVAVTDAAPLVFWAVSIRGVAELYAARLDATREVHKLASNALAWQLAPFGNGSALCVVAQNGVKRNIVLYFTDATGQLRGKPQVLRDRSLAQLDLDMANIDGHLVLTWSEQSHLEPTLFAAAVDPSGRVSQPAKRLTAPMGEQALVRVVPPAPATKQGYVVWENLNQARQQRRLFQVAPLLANATLGGARATLEMHGEAATLPEFQATPSGLAALSQAPMCLKPPEPCSKGELLPTYVEFDATLNLLASEPIRLADTGGAGIDLAWGLGCDQGNCSALAAPRSGPAPIYWVSLAKVSDIFAPIAHTNFDERRPRLAANEAWQEVDPLADLAAITSSDAELVSWVTYFDPTLPYEQPKTPAPDGRYAPVRALLQTLHTGKLDNEPTTISLRARSLGGVALAPSNSHDLLLGWTAIDRKVPQVFLTKLSADGRKQQLKMLTNTPGEVGDVALARLNDGWAVGWVDERHGDPEVYAVKVDDRLNPASPEQRLTESEGGAADLALATIGDAVLAVWGDTKGSKQRGVANILTRALNAGDLAPRGPERTLQATSRHSHSVRVSPFQQGAAIAWLEDGATHGTGEADSALPVVRLVLVDSSGRPKAEPVSIDVGAKSLSGLALDCGTEHCHLVFGGAHDHQPVLWAAVYSATGEVTSTLLTTLTGSPSQQLSPTLHGDVVFLGEQSREGQTRLRRLHILWE